MNNRVYCPIIRQGIVHDPYRTHRFSNQRRAAKQKALTLIDIHETESGLLVSYRCLYLPMPLLVIPPGMIYEQGGRLLDGTLSAGETIGLLLGIVIPLIIVAYFIEFAEFSFSKQSNQFRWRWRNLFRQQGSDFPLNRVVKIRLENLDTRDLVGMQPRFRLQVILDDGTGIALTRGYLSFYKRRMDKIVDQVRDYLGHVTPMA